LDQELAGVRLRPLHPQVFTDSDDSYLKIPSLKPIRANKTRFWQFGAIFEDEGTIDGIYGVHESIFLQQLRLQAPDDPNGIPDDFHSRSASWCYHSISVRDCRLC